ncbi:hypothetical protein BCR43DRAFT_525162 [Syncephalastrum racemosum]|uniref:FAD-binding domain-containing protein n=1 Tax=Syncephalastrum racemosum TaxID=13706 RepID=A0A1X2H9S0_SYNRA|nr:hypothetical protein BCR43DRAFT_525162 [Syncephalastrum racemosum]
MQPVLIIGGGLAGLTLANVLKEDNVPYVVFERDASPTGRNQGWSINIQSALPFLKSGINPDKFSFMPSASAVHPEKPWEVELAMVNVQKDPNEVLAKVDFKDMPDKAIHINRGRFRHWLLEGINIEWNKEFEAIQEEEDGVTVTFKDGTHAKGSLVVGADGSRSRVCQHRLGKDTFWNNTVKNPVRMLCGSMEMTEEEWKPFKEAFARTLMMLLGADDKRTYRGFGGVADYNHGQDKPYTIQWGISCLDEEAPSYDTDQERLAQLKDWANRSMAGLARTFYNSIPDGAPVASITFLERLPSVLRDSRSQHPRICIIGDAAHCMTPNRGDGGNHAMIDAVKLGQALGKMYQGQASLADILEGYEEEMISRASAAVLASREATKLYHGPPGSSIAMAEELGAMHRARVDAMRKERETKDLDIPQ